MKKIFTLFLFSMITFNAIHAEVTWELSEDGTLTISGTDMPDYIGNAAPWSSNKSSIMKVVINDGVTNIGDKAFYDYPYLRSVNISNSVTSIGYLAFARSVVRSITIPNSVTSIGNSAFSRCSGLTSVTIPNSVTSIGDSAFCGCSGLTSVTIPNSVTGIGKRSFMNCSGLTSVTIPNSVTSIGDYAFADCSSLTSVTIPNSVTSIGEEAFYDCSALTSVTIPNSVTSIGGYAFYGTKWYDNQPDGVVYAGKVLYAYKGTMPSNTKIDIKDGTKGIGDLAFRVCSGLTSVTIPNSVTSIGERAFEKCSRLTSITIPNSVTSIGMWAFYGCSGLTSVTIPNSVTSIGESAFLNCSGLTSLTIPNSVTSIGMWAFAFCSGLTSLTIPNSVTSIGYSAFGYCSGLTSLTIPNSVTSIGEFAFYGCSSLASLTIPNSVTNIGGEAFAECRGLDLIICEASTPPSCYDKCFYDINKSIPVYVPTNSINAYKEAIQWKDFSNILPISNDQTPALTLALTLTDKNSDLTKGYYKKGKVSLSRNNMLVGDYATFCIPFDIDLSKTTDVFSKVYVPLNIGLLKSSGELLMLLDEVNNNAIIKSGQAFVAKCQKSNVVLENCADVSFDESIPNPTPSNVKIYNFDGVSGALTQNTDVKIRIGGTYSQLKNLESNRYCTLFTNGSFGSVTNVTPFQMYVYIDGGTLGSKITSITFDFHDEATGIKELRMTNDNSPVYDLNGRMVNEKNLKSGLYIKNGKKVVIK